MREVFAGRRGVKEEWWRLLKVVEYGNSETGCIADETRTPKKVMVVSDQEVSIICFS